MVHQRLPAAELRKIQPDHLLHAIHDLDEGVEHLIADSTGYDLVYQGKHYPPKAVLGIAGRYALNRELGPEHFSGGENSTCFKILRQVKMFSIVQKRRAFLLTWNPSKFQVEDFRKELADYFAGAETLRWSVGSRKDLPDGSDLFLMRLGVEPKGIVGMGVSIGDVEYQEHWDGAKADGGTTAHYVAFKPSMIQENPYVSLAELQANWPMFDWTPQGSGIEIHDPGIIRFLHGHGSDPGQKYPEEVDAPDVHVEGAVIQVTVNAYERDPSARLECLAHHGYRCAVCERSMAEIYGPIGEGVIHIHHRTPLHTIGKAYQVNPIKDLVPVCPNCHAVLHRTIPAMDVDALKKLLAVSIPEAL